MQGLLQQVAVAFEVFRLDSSQRCNQDAKTASKRGWGCEEEGGRQRVPPNSINTSPHGKVKWRIAETTTTVTTTRH